MGATPLAEEIGKRVEVVVGDITLERLGRDAETYDALTARVTHIVHAAAEIGVNQTPARFAKVNVEGTMHVLLFADASLLPHSMGNPPMLTIMALDKRVARLAAK